MIITHINFAKGFRGGERQTLLLLEGLSRLNFKQQLLIKESNSMFNQRVKYIKNLKILNISKPYLFKLHYIKNSSIIFAHEAKAYQFAYIANMVYKIPYAITRRVDFNIKSNFFNKTMYKSAKEVICISSSVSQKVKVLDSGIITKIIPDAISELDINQKSIQSLGKRFKDKIIIGNIAALDKLKGQREIIEVATYYEKFNSKIHFLILGDGDDKEYLLDKSKGLSNITFEGFVDNVGDYLQIMDIFLFPTHSEGFGSILLDVMSAKIPVIANNTGGIPDIIEDNVDGLLLKTLDKESIIQKIQILLKDKELSQKLAQNAYNRLDRYTIQNIANRYKEIIDEL